MEWITKQEVEDAALKSEIDAINCSIEHWDQLATCTFEEFKSKLMELTVRKNIIQSDYCSLCSRYPSFCKKFNKTLYSGTERCPVVKSGENCCGSNHTWQKAKDAFSNLFDCGIYVFYAEERFLEFRETAVDMREMLKEVKQFIINR